MTELFKHQIEFLDKKIDKSALIWSCGTGKTRTAIEWSNACETTLIVCPKPLKTNWAREVSLWAGRGRRYAKIMTKEEFRRDFDSLSYFHQVIIDEVHNGFLTPHFKSQMSKALRSYLKKHEVERVLLLSATPYSSSPWNIYNLAYYLGFRWNWKRFNIEFFDQVRMGPRIIPVAKKGCEKKLAVLLKKIADVVDINDVMDVPLQYHAEPEYFALSLEQRHAIKKNYDPLPIVRYTLQHEIENGILIGNEFLPSQEFHSDKNDRILSLVEENPKIAIICRYNAQIDALRTLLLAHGTEAYVIRGDVKDRDSVCRLADAALRAVVLIQADCNAGYELPSFPLVVFASMSYSYVAWQQMQGRFLRINNPSRTTFLYLLSEDNSIDKAVYECIQKKQDFQIALFNK